MNSLADSQVLYESSLSIFNGRLRAICIAALYQSSELLKIRVTSSSDPSVLLDCRIEANAFGNFCSVLRQISDARKNDPGLLGPRVEASPNDAKFPFRLIVEPGGNEETISLPLAVPPPQEQTDYVLHLFAKERAQHQAQIAKTEEVSKKLQETIAENNTLKLQCEYQEKEIRLLRQLSQAGRSDGSRKRPHLDSFDTPTKKRRCGCEDDGESCGTDCDGYIEDDDQDDPEDLAVFKAATTQLKMTLGQKEENVEVSSEGGNSSTKPSNEFMKQFEKLSSVIVKAPNMPSTSGISTMQIKMEDGQERSGPLIGPSEEQNVKQKVVGVVQYVICQLCPEAEQKSMDLSNQKEMEEHFLDKHVDKEKKKCEACPTDQFQPHNIGQHYRLHTNSVYACEHCGKRGRRNYLMSHIRTHTGERPYSCDTCPKSFSDSSTLRRHRLVHTGEKKYQCPVCGRAIARKDNVKAHIRSHGIYI